MIASASSNPAPPQIKGEGIPASLTIQDTFSVEIFLSQLSKRNYRSICSRIAWMGASGSFEKGYFARAEAQRVPTFILSFP
jgi:hypothetical protein